LKNQLGENAKIKALERHNQETAFNTFIEILNSVDAHTFEFKN
jgi:hypothetical protein